MPDLRFLRAPRWIGLAVFVVLLAGVSIRLGIWQFHKLDLRQDRNELVREHLDSDPVALDDAVPAGSNLQSDDEWRMVTMTGTYDTEVEVTVKYISRDGVPGVDVVTPLVLDDGTAILVDRGFLETERTNARPEHLPEPADGEVEVTGWLRVNSGATGDAVRVHDGQIRAISSDALEEDLPYELRDGYVNVQEQDPAPTDESLVVEPTPDLGQGPHFFYGLQWWFFAALAILGFGWFARAEIVQRRDQPKPAEATEPETVKA